MFNFGFFIADLVTDPKVSFDQDNKVTTNFDVVLTIQGKQVGLISVTCFKHLATLAAAHLRIGDRVAVAGFLLGDEWREVEGEKEHRLEVAVIDLEKIQPWP